MCIVIWVPDADPALSGVLPPMNMNFLEHIYINRAACFARTEVPRPRAVSSAAR